MRTPDESFRGYFAPYRTMKEHTKKEKRMSADHTREMENHESNIEDLTLDEAKTESVKGGRFVFGLVEREMKESGEKGGTED